MSEDAYSFALKIYERSEYIGDSKHALRSMRQTAQHPGDLAFIDEVEFYLERFWSTGIKHKIYKPSKEARA